MGRNEIRLRRQKMSSGRIARHRNYGELMDRHEREIRLRRIVKIFVYFLIILALLVMFVIVRRWEQRKENVKPETRLVRTAISKISQSEIRFAEPTEKNETY